MSSGTATGEACGRPQMRRGQRLTANDRSLSTPAKPAFMKQFAGLSNRTYVDSAGPRKPGARRVTDGGQTAGLILHTCPRRRESFLYKSTDSELNTSTRSSRNHSLTGDDTSLAHSEEIIITPFAQVLSSLKKIRVNFMLLTNISSTNSKNDTKTAISEKEEVMKTASMDTLEELEWCLNQLETLQTSQSVSNLASVKFKRILSKELHLGDDGDSANKQVSDYIFKTFLEEKDTLPVVSRSQLFDHLLQQSLVGTQSDDNELFLSMTIQQRVVIEKFLDSQAGQWNIDIFFLNEITNSQPLSFIAYHIFKTHNLFSKFQLPVLKFVQLLHTIELKYNSQIPYHNNIHAADVTHTTHMLLTSSALKNVFSDIEVFAILLASIIHDVDHPGVTNQFLVNTNDKLALVYNDISVLENHHLAVAFQIFHSSDYFLFQSLDKKETQNIRRLIIDMVLATDMSKHMSLLADLKTLVETKKVSGSSVLGMDNYMERIQVLQVMIHCSDLSNPTKTLSLYQRWVARIMEEFFQQGDRERTLSLDLSPMCDRTEVNVSMAQVRFIDYIVHPLWETWSDLVHPDGQFVLDRVEQNRAYFDSDASEHPS